MDKKKLTNFFQKRKEQKNQYKNFNEIFQNEELFQDNPATKFDQIRNLIKEKIRLGNEHNKNFERTNNFLKNFSIEILNKSPLILRGLKIEDCLNAAEIIMNVNKKYISHKIIHKRIAKNVFAPSDGYIEILCSISKRIVDEEEINKDSHDLQNKNYGETIVSNTSSKKEKRYRSLKKSKNLIDEDSKKIYIGIKNFKNKTFVTKNVNQDIYVYVNKEKSSAFNMNTLIKFFQLNQIKSYSKEKIQDIIYLRKYDQWVKVASISDHNDIEKSSETSRFEIQTTENKMKCYLIIYSHQRLGELVSIDQVLDKLKRMGVIYGVDKDKINTIIEYQIFNVNFCIAKGKEPIQNRNIGLDLKFNINKGKMVLNHDNFNRVDFFGDHGLIKNVIPEQVIADVIPSKKGENGKNIFGEDIPLEEREETDIQLGENVQYSLDKRQILSKISGRPIYQGGKIDVKSSYKVNGNVGLQTGSIMFLGDIIVKGSVEDGFNLEATGDIYVKGSVGRCNIKANGDIIILGGIMGKGSNFIKSNNNIFAKFVEKSNISCSGYLVIPEGSLHSVINSEYVISLGKRGSIIGGNICVFREVNVKVIGSSNFSETKVECGLNPILRQELVKLQDKSKFLKEELKKVDLNLETLQKKIQRNPEEKKKLMYKKLSINKVDMELQLKESKTHIQAIREELEKLSELSKISVQDTIYPGVEISIRNVNMKISDSILSKTFILDAGKINTVPYEDFTDQKILDLGNVKF